MLERKAWHESLTDDLIIKEVIMHALEKSSSALCVACGAKVGSVAIDLRDSICPACGESQLSSTDVLMLEI